MRKWARVCWRCLHWSAQLGIAIIILLGSLGIVGTLYLSYSPVSLQKVLPYMQTQLPAGLEMQVEDIHLGFDRRFFLMGRGLTFREKNGPVVARVEEAEVAISNQWLFAGKILPRHIKVRKVAVHLGWSREGLKIGQKLLQQGTGKKEQPEASLVAQLNHWQGLAGVAALKTVRLSGMEILLRDEVRAVTWLLHDAGMVFTRNKERGEKLTATGILRQKSDARKIPILATFAHAPHALEVGAKIKFEEANTDFIASYVPPRLQGLLTSQGRLELGGVIDQNNAFQDPWFTMRLAETEIFPKEAYSHPLKFASLDLTGRYDKEKDVLNIEDLRAQDAQGIVLRVRGQAEGLEGDPQLRLQLVSSDMTLEQLIHYLPDKELDKTVPWLQEKTEGVQLKNIRVGYNGRPSLFPHCRKSCGLEAYADIAGGAVRFLEDAAPVREVSGTFTLKEDWFNVAATHGRWAGQVGTEVSVTSVGLFTPVDNQMYIKGTGEGALAQLLRELGRGLHVSDIPVAEGKHKTDFDISFPIKPTDEEPALHEIKMDIVSQVEDFRMPLEPLDGEVLSGRTAQVKIKDTTLAIDTSGKLADIPLTVRWRSRLDRPYSSGKISIEADVPTARIDFVLEQLDMEATGTIPLSLKLDQTGESVFNVEGAADLSTASVKVPWLNWVKKSGQDVQADVRGRLDFRRDKPVVDLAFLSITGEEVEIAGSAYLQPGTQPTLQLSPLKAGAQDVSVVMKPGHLELIGKRLDLRGISLFGEEKGGGFLAEEMILTLDVEELLISAQGALQDVRGRMQREAGQWRQGDVSGHVAGKPFQVAVSPAPVGSGRKFSFMMQDTGKLMAALGLYNKLRGGFMRGQLLMENGHGTGDLVITDARILDAPVMAQLLAILSLEPLLDSKAGIGFDKISVPLKLSPNVVNIMGARFEGPSMDMKLKGYYNIVEDKVNLDGSLVPAVGVNKFINNIPLVGGLLTGSQDGVLVADFKIKGLSANPEVSANPLSLVTPGLLKDIFR
jgi:hypothetical protein